MPVDRQESTQPRPAARAHRRPPEDHCMKEKATEPREENPRMASPLGLGIGTKSDAPEQPDSTLSVQLRGITVTTPTPKMHSHFLNKVRADGQKTSTGKKAQLKRQQAQ